MAQIIVMDGPGVGTTYELGAMNSIGRGNRCNIRLNSATLRDQQAMIKRNGSSFAIVTNTPNGVLVNGQPVQQERRLIHGDMITLADIMLLYGEENNEPDAEDDDVLTDPTVSAVYGVGNSKDAVKGLHETKHAAQNMEILLKVSNAIMSKMEVRQLLQELLDIIFEELPADRGTILLRSPKGNKLWPMAAKRIDGKPLKIAGKPQVSQTIIRRVLKDKEGVLTKDAQEDHRFQEGLSISAQKIRAAICVPMIGKNGAILGVIHIDATREGKVFTPDHLRLVTAIAMQGALAIENALLVKELSEKERIQQELTIASDIQMELLPKTLPQLSGLEVHGIMRPAKEVGGDYYDFLIPEGNPNNVYICIGDVSGKGVPAGLVMVMARCFLRPLIMSCQKTKVILEEMNKYLVVDTRKDMFMSMLILYWDPEKQSFSWTGAGHEHLLIYRAKTKKCEAIRAGGIVLGMLKKASKFFKENELHLDAGDAVVLYTDGVTEAVNPQRRMFGLKRAIQLVEKYGDLNSEQICANMLNDLKRFMGNAAQHDDITLVAIKKN